MTAFRLFDVAPNTTPAEPKPTTISRAYCLTCEDFTVLPETNACEICGAPLDRRYQFVELDVEDDDE